MPVAPLLQRFVDDELARATALIEHVRLETIAQLQSLKADPAQPIELAKQELRLGYDIAQLLGQQPARWREAFVAALRETALGRVAQGPARPSAAGDDGLAGPGGFALMDEAQIEADIEMSRALMLLDDAVEWEQRELQTFTSALYGDTHVSDGSNPFSPDVYAQALWQAARALQPLTPAGQRLLLRVSATALAPRLKLAYAAACSRLESQGVEPSLYRTQTLRPGGVAERHWPAPVDPRPVFDVTRPGALEGLLDSLPSASAAAASPPAAPAARADRRSGDSDLERALGRIDRRLQQDRRQPTAPQRDAAPSLLGRDRGGLASSASGGHDRRVIELMAQMFDAMLSDPLLPAAARGAVARLQVSALRVALHDAALLQAHDHPTWRFIDRLAELLQDAAADPLQQADAVACCDALIDEIVRRPQPDEALYRDMLARLDGWAAERLKAAQRAARPIIESLEHLERRLRLQTFVRARLEEQIAAALLPAAIQRFLLGPWSTLIADAMLTGGERGEATTRHAQTVDQLLRSLEPPVDAAERQAQMRLLPGLLQSLRDGMTQLRLPAAEQQAFLDELLAAHADTLRVGAGVAEPVRETVDEAPADIMRRLRDEPPDAAGMPGGGGSHADSVIDVPALDTVPSALLPSRNAAGTGGAARVDAEASAQRWAETVQPGEPVRLWLAGGWRVLRLLWRSGSGELLLFCAPGGATHALTRGALARLQAEGLAGRPVPPTLIQRAVDRIAMQAALPAPR